jgi:hypothetical protein
MALFPLVLAVHVCLALALFLPSLLLPFALRARHADDARRGRFVRALVWLQAGGSGYVALGLAVTGAILVVFLGPTILARPWLLVALAIYAVNLGLSFFVQRPGLRRLFSRAGSGDPDRWRAAARRQRYVSYVMAGAVGLIGFLMTSKPDLW